LEEDSPTVLIIDDISDIRTYVKSLLSGRISSARGCRWNIKELSFAMKLYSDIIISDVLMPGLVVRCRMLSSFEE
jgi:CheY-like chemotaxis protein